LRAPRSRLIATAAIIAAGTFTLAAAAASGIEPTRPTSIPDSAFTSVVLPSANADVPILRDPMPLPTADPAAGAEAGAGAQAARAQPSLPSSKPIVVTVAPKTTHVIAGRASWYCRASISPCTVDHPDDGGVDAYAAAGPRLRAAIGSDWRGKIVYVDGRRVRLIDWCECHEGESIEKLLDLYYDVYAQTGPAVRVRW
jgi:hypothetical protein